MREYTKLLLGFVATAALLGAAPASLRAQKENRRVEVKVLVSKGIVTIDHRRQLDNR